MFEVFSNGYYLSRLYIEPGVTEYPAINDEHYESIAMELYSGDTTKPLVMKIGNFHVRVYGDDTVPGHTIRLPEEIMQSSDITNPPTLKEVFLAKASRVEQLTNLAA